MCFAGSGIFAVILRRFSRPCSLTIASSTTADPAPGYVVRSQEKIGYVMLEIFDSPSTQFEQGRVAGGEEERERIRTAFHEEVSTPMIAALFMIEEAKRELEEAGLPQAEIVSKASDVLTEVTKKIGQVLGESDRNPE
jgi:hypothetical protein